MKIYEVWNKVTSALHFNLADAKEMQSTGGTAVGFEISEREVFGTTQADVALNDVLVELNACETIETSYEHLAGGHGEPIKMHLAITGPQELLDRLHNAIIRGRGKRN